MPIVEVSSKGQIVIPKKIREDLGIVPGRKLLLRSVPTPRSFPCRMIR